MLYLLVNQKLTIPVVSPSGLCALKFFAWEERHIQHPGRDAKDIAYLFKNIEHYIHLQIENHPRSRNSRLPNKERGIINWDAMYRKSEMITNS